MTAFGGASVKFQKRHVDRAFLKIREKGIAPNRESKKWDIIDPTTGDRFPPKAVLRIAKELAGDETWSGGGGPQTNGPLRARGFEILLKPGLEISEAATDIRDVLKSGRDETTKERLVNARLGQGGFREELLEIWKGQCALTGCDIPAVLRASHIKPWRASSDSERLDPSNGILLAASIDALFDKFLITFSNEGRLEIMSGVEAEKVRKLGIGPGQRISLSADSLRYMEWHRKASETGT